MTEVAGCRDKLEVCCFTWNNYQVRDMTDKGIGLPMPWSQNREYGGKGVMDPPEIHQKKKKRKVALAFEENDLNKDYDSPVVVILRHKKKT